MTIKAAFDYSIFTLLGSYNRREATNIMSIIFQDLFHITNSSRTDDFDHKEELDLYLKRLKKHEPLAYILGSTNFFGYDFKINNHVLIPRPETEELVHWILTDHKKDHLQRDVLDIGTGSGCICVTLKKKKPTFRMFGIEESMDALNCSRINAKNLKARIEFFRSDFLDKSIWDAFGAFDIIVSNPPYIPEKEKKKMSENVLDYEPDMALFVPDDDPLLFYRSILEFSLDHLKSNGYIYLEINEFNADEVVALYEDKYKNIELRKDMQGKNRMLKVSNSLG